MKVFHAEGIIIGSIARAGGSCPGVFLVFRCRFTAFGSIRSVLHRPASVAVTGADYALVAIAALVICTISKSTPRRAASMLSPVEGLRWE